ncbi:MAG: VTC domain-containing protein [Anaerolineaceae bacterium]|nr:VTC domain-containing protein [Anaerolineaceae bacterium]
MDETVKILPAQPETIYRYERKFLVDQLDTHQVRAMVKRHPAMFTTPYPPRYVNNIYFDTKDMANYHENVSGVKDRRKARIRWYGDLFGQISNPVIELKIKSGLVGTKEQHPSDPFMLDENFTDHYFKNMLHSSNLPAQLKYFLRDMDPVLVNRYYRWYFASVDGIFRVTIDTEMTFHKINPLKNNFLFRQFDYNNIVVELKYGAEYDPQAQKISTFFPFSVTKSSKYVQGIERVYL